jgi:hypothetical protein
LPSATDFIDFRSHIGGIGPVSVDPAAQNVGIGKQLMQAVMDEAINRKQAGMRLVQLAYHNRSLCLYSTLGFQTQQPLSIINGQPLRCALEGYLVRPLFEADIIACERLSERVHGMARSVELQEAATNGSGMVIEHLNTISGYTTGVGFFGHTVADDNKSMMALIAAAPEFSGPGFFVPTQNHELLCWCLKNGLRLEAQAHLMTVGHYNEPAGSWLPSVLY